jgi:DNA repair exonuclease SbcCD nuclease subunit
MTNNLFKKAAVCTDLHIGNKSNSIQHNQDCEDFIDWFVSKAKKEGCETCFFLGDWHHHRASINIQSLSVSLRCLEKLSKSFDTVFFIPGNHDLYYRDKRDIHSIEWAKHLSNVILVNDWFKEKDVIISPWLVGDDHKKLAKMQSKYLFGHFELPNFMMNAQVMMPDHGEVNSKDMVGFEQVFSGHFHKRQAKNNIWYIGNAFPHNYADAGDDARGMMILTWGEEPEFHAWPNQPTFRVYNLSTVLDNPAGYLFPNSHVRINLDIEISYEEANFIRETLIPEHKLREMVLIPVKGESILSDGASSVKFESVDQIIMEEITNIQSDFYDTKILSEIYRNL